MTWTDELKILDDKIKANQAGYDLGREEAKISALSSKDLLEKLEYLTGEDLEHRPSVLEKTKFEYSPLGEVLADNVKKKINTNKVNIKKKTKIYYIIQNVALQNLKISMNLKNYHSTLCTKYWMTLKEDLISLKLFIHKQMKIKSWNQNF